MSGQIDTRYEIKMVCARDELPRARAWVRLHPAGFQTAYPPRRVNNIYFDTPDLGCWNDHLDGVPERRKLRFRWYGETQRPAGGQIEVKQKNERVGWKLTQPVDQPLDLDNMNWNDVLNILRSSCAGKEGLEIREMLAYSRPMLISHYRREYFVTPDRTLRLTLDYNLHSYDQLFGLTPNLVRLIQGGSPVVIELKAAARYAQLISDAVAQFPLRAWPYSKYVNAVNSLLDY